MEEKKRADLIEASDISELEELFNNQKRDGSPKVIETKVVPVPKQVQKVVPVNSVESVSQDQFDSVGPIIAPVQEQPIPQPTNVSREGLSFDNIISNIIERKKSQIRAEAEAKEKATIDRFYGKLEALIESAATDTPLPILAKPQPPPIALAPIELPPAPIEDSLPEGKRFRAKSPDSSKQSNPKKGTSLGTLIKAGILVFIATVSVVVIAIHFFG